jgi:hypothetical protein
MFLHNFIIATRLRVSQCGGTRLSEGVQVAPPKIGHEMGFIHDENGEAAVTALGPMVTRQFPDDEHIHRLDDSGFGCAARILICSSHHFRVPLRKVPVNTYCWPLKVSGGGSSRGNFVAAGIG